MVDRRVESMEIAAARRSSLGLAFVLACGPVVTSPAGEGSTDADSSTTAVGPTTDPTTVDPTANAEVTTSPSTTVGTSVGTTIEPETTTTDPSGNDDCGPGDCCDFVCPPDVQGDDFECEVWEQDCPRGEKCTPWSNDGSNRWTASRCVPLVESPSQAGDPCTVEGSGLSGIDDCAFGLLCLWVDPETLVGTCVADCSGSPENPICADPSTVCVTEFDGYLHQCMPNCDPFLQDCERGTCFAFGEFENVHFACGVPLVPTIVDFEPCTHDWECAAGSMCPRDEHDPACEAGRCCTPMCDLEVPDACADGRVCRPILPEGQGPPEFHDEGYCALP